MQEKAPWPWETGLRLSVSPSSTTGLASSLDAKEHVRRRSHPRDRRAIQLVLTEKGRTAVDRELGFYRALLEQTLAPLGAEVMSMVLGALVVLERSNAGRDVAQGDPDHGFRP